jgi:hypothetical protein
MVRLVFRPYTQIWRTICTSVPLRASTRVSSGFTLFRHSSPSFGSQQIRSYSNTSAHGFDVGQWCRRQASSHLHSLSFRIRVCHSNTRVDVGLLGPCFKTGHLKPFCQHPKHSSSSLGREASHTLRVWPEGQSSNAASPQARTLRNVLQSSIQPIGKAQSISPYPERQVTFLDPLNEAKLMLTWHREVHDGASSAAEPGDQHWFQTFPL